MALTEAQLAARHGKLTGSRFRPLMDGDSAGILKLWLEMTGQQEEEDLSDVWPVQLGIVTEHLNLDWFERRNQLAVVRRGEVVVHESGLFAVTLDGWIRELKAPIDAKHVGGREPNEIVVGRYQPQMQLQMELTGATQAALSIIRGADAPVVEWVERDEAYAAEMLRRGRIFMRHVHNKTPPVPLPPAPVPHDEMIEIQMETEEWWRNAERWLQTHGALEIAKDAEKILKSLMPANARRAYGAGVRISRDRAGRLSLREFTP